MTRAEDPRDLERRVPEPDKATGRTGRSEYARDRARVLHCSSLRRLADKTQVVEPGDSDFPRTRLTHTLEVAQIARELGASLGADPDLVDTAALAHDLGHPPFGHNGEDALHVVAAGIGGFEGNAQTLRILSRLEAKAADEHGASVGLNLTRASLDAAIKYPWTVADHPDRRKFGAYADDIEAFDWARLHAPEPRRSFETQIMDWADDVAYSVHDVEDAIHGEHLLPATLTDALERKDVIELAVLRYASGLPTESLQDHLERAYDRLLGLEFWVSDYDGSFTALRRLKNLTSQLIGRFAASAERATRAAFGDAPLSRYAADLVVPEESRAEVAVLKSLANKYVMQRPDAPSIYEAQRAMIIDVADLMWSTGRDSIETWLVHEWDAAVDDDARLRVIVDQIASFTDTSIRRVFGGLRA